MLSTIWAGVIAAEMGAARARAAVKMLRMETIFAVVKEAFVIELGVSGEKVVVRIVDGAG